MMRNRGWALLLALVLLALPLCASAAGVFSPNENYEYLVGSTAWQLSAESQALMQQAFTTAKGRIAELALKCLSDSDADWAYETDESGAKWMTHLGKRIAVISDIDDTLVDGVHYTADIVGKNGDVNNVAFARFVLSDGCTALPGAVDFVQYCNEMGVEFFYVTNRYDQGYRVGQNDSVSGYDAVVGKDGHGLYLDAQGTEIGCTVYQALGKSFYDITLESMTRLGFPIDEKHLIVNDMKLHGDSKEPARAAVRSGATAYPTGQREDGNASGSALTIDIAPHEVALLLGDQLSDFTDDFSGEGMDAVTRTEKTAQYADKWGVEWIVLPNAVYGAALNYAVKYPISELLGHYSYLH